MATMTDIAARLRAMLTSSFIEPRLLALAGCSSHLSVGNLASGAYGCVGVTALHPPGHCWT